MNAERHTAGSTAGNAVGSRQLVRVERGHANPEELAAVTALLLARAASVSAPTGPARPVTRAGWRRLERSSGFRAPHSWQG